MDFQKHAWLLAVIEGLRKQGSWTGKTHVQKTLFLIQTATECEPPFEFVLYRHGPYSFDAQTELEQMKSYDAVAVDAVPGFGVMIRPGGNAGFVKQKQSLTLEEQNAVERVCGFVGERNVAELERLATTAWIRRIEGLTDPRQVAARLNDIKPHISLEDGAAADKELMGFLAV